MKCQSILIVEDDDEIRNALRMVLEIEGYTVQTAANGKEGLAILATIQPPCLILLDMMMPVMDGWAFAEALRADMVLTSIPVVMVTAYAEKAADAMKQAHGIIKKPVDIDLLMKTVKQHCN